MLDILRVGVSAGGAVPKAVVAINEDDHIISGQGEIPKGYEHYIIKLDGISLGPGMRPGQSQDNCRVEYAYSLMARAAGIEMTECRLLEENGRAHFITRRFDRAHNQKIHCLSLACIGHHGWNPIGSTSYEMAFQVMRMLSLPYPEQDQQFRRMVFNAIAGNVDDHVKNISYTMDSGGIWHLSPAYDVTFSVNPEDGLGEMHKLSINGKHANLSREDFRQVAYNMEIKKADRIIDEVRDVVAGWQEIAREAGVSPEVIDHIGRYHLKDEDLKRAN
jgi:serine/threonine-protein kinase HipA